MLILVEGADGSGKTTLCNVFKTRGYNVIEPVPRQAINQYGRWLKLALKSIYKGETYIFDRSFISEIVYRRFDNKPCNILLSEATDLLKYCKIVYCETKTQFDDAMRRGEANITDRRDAEKIRSIYENVLSFFKQFERVPILQYNWRVDDIISVVNFIKYYNRR